MLCAAGVQAVGNNVEHVEPGAAAVVVALLFGVGLDVLAQFIQCSPSFSKGAPWMSSALHEKPRGPKRT